MTILTVFVAITCVLVFVSYINEKTLKLPNEIALLLSSFVIGGIYILITYVVYKDYAHIGFPIEYLSDFLVKGVLCFMLFAGSCNITLGKLKKYSKPIALLALLTTTLATVLFGLVFYFILGIIGGHQFSLIECLLLGAIVSPTDPIAATSILKKVGLSEELILIIEGESLFNDGVGIALFVAISSALSSTSGSIDYGSFFFVLGKEIFGAIILAVVICFLMFYFFKRTEDKILQIFISIFTLTSSYVLSQNLGFSSAIAAVVCGIYFATFTNKADKKKPGTFTLYYDFWEVVDSLLNAILYIGIGVFFVNIFLYTKENILIMLVAVVSCVIARYVGVFFVSLCLKKIPEKMSKSSFSSLLTWAGLKGGLSLALMIEVVELLETENFHIMIVSVFSIVMFTTVIQGLTVEKHYKFLKKLGK